MTDSRKPIQVRITVELHPRDGIDTVPRTFSFDYYSIDSRLLAYALADYLLPVSEAIDKRNSIPRSEIGSIRDSFIHFRDRQPAPYSETYNRLERIRHLIISSLPDPQPRLF